MLCASQAGLLRNKKKQQKETEKINDDTGTMWQNGRLMKEGEKIKEGFIIVGI